MAPQAPLFLQKTPKYCRMFLQMTHKILLFYRYTGIDNPQALMERERAVCEVLDLKGRIIVAHEGINATVEGTVDNIEKYKKHILSDPRFKKMQIKESVGTGVAFPRLQVKVKDEIVSTKLPKHINPQNKTGKYVQPHELKKMYEQGEDFVIIDMRNDYEFASGHFKNSINPKLNSSRDLIQKVNELKIHKDKKVVTVCTGGVRCEKMSAFLLDQGFKDVHQLHNGMHGYMEKYPGQDFLGTLYTFDNRKVMDFGGQREIVGKCFTCENKTERYENCSNLKCHEHILICDDCVAKNMGEPYCKRCVDAGVAVV